jgi:hypothetical protein
MSDRKIGNNKEACKKYAAGHQLEKNKKRNKARAERQAEHAYLKLMKRYQKGKPVRSSFVAGMLGTSKGNMPNGAHLKQAA